MYIMLAVLATVGLIFALTVKVKKT